jgi:hypothetical protein
MKTKYAESALLLSHIYTVPVDGPLFFQCERSEAKKMMRSTFFSGEKQPGSRYGARGPGANLLHPQCVTFHVRPPMSVSMPAYVGSCSTAAGPRPCSAAALASFKTCFASFCLPSLRSAPNLKRPLHKDCIGL